MEGGNLSAKARIEAWEGIPGGNLTRGSLTLQALSQCWLHHGLSGKAPVQSRPADSWQAEDLHASVRGETGEGFKGMGTSVHATICLGKHLWGEQGTDSLR